MKPSEKDIEKAKDIFTDNIDNGTLIESIASALAAEREIALNQGKEFTERVAVQLNKLINACKEENYNNNFLEPAKKLLTEMREGLQIQRVRFDGVEYKTNENYINKIRFAERLAVVERIEKVLKEDDYLHYVVKKALALCEELKGEKCG
jgi:hypothetical protein